MPAPKSSENTPEDQMNMQEENLTVIPSAALSDIIPLSPL